MRFTWASLALLVACSSSAGSAPPPATACLADETKQDDGSCRPPGVGACANGFVADASRACVAIVPADACPDGKMAVPGDATCKDVGVAEPPVCSAGMIAAPGEACRAISDCGAAPWGNAPAAAQYVDAAFAGTSDGTARAPWKTIAAAIAAAKTGDVVAIAAGSYKESADLSAKAVKLYGRCASMVEIVGAGAPALTIGASGAEAHAIAFTGGDRGVQVAKLVRDVVLDSIWVHDTKREGVVFLGGASKMTGSLVENGFGFGVRAGSGANVTLDGVVVRGTIVDTAIDLGIGINPDPGSTMTLHRVVVEANGGAGILMRGSTLDGDGVVLRDTKPQGSLVNGWGVGVEPDPDTKARAKLTLRSSLVARNRHVGVFVAGSDATLESTAIVGTLPQASDSKDGVGIFAQHEKGTTQKSNVIVRGSLLASNRLTGIYLKGADLTLDATAIRDTLVEDKSNLGGAGATADESDDGHGHAVPSSMTISGSHFERNSACAIYVANGALTMDATLVRDTKPAHDGGAGCGVEAAAYENLKTKPTVVIRGSVFERNMTYGIGILSGEATIEDTVVRDTRSRTDGAFGQGIALAIVPNTPFDPKLALARSVVERNHEAAVSVSHGAATISGCSLRDTLAHDDGTYGDGVALVAGDVSIDATRIVGNHRTGITNFAGHVVLATTTLACNAIQLDGELGDPSGDPYDFELAPGTTCGCSGTADRCQVLSTHLAPPFALMPGQRPKL